MVALGKIAFDSYLGTYPARGLQLPSPRPRFGHGVTYTLEGTSLSPSLLRGDTGGYGIVLIGSYHPSQQNTQTGRLTREMFEGIFQSARQVLDQVCGRLDRKGVGPPIAIGAPTSAGALPVHPELVEG